MPVNLIFATIESMIGILKPKKLFKYIWFAFGLTGLAIVAKQYFPNLSDTIKNSSLVKGVQTELDQSTQDADFSTSLEEINLKNLDPQTASQVIGKIVKQEITQVLEVVTEEIKEFPARQVKKIKIGACEELLEEDICSVAEQLDCSPND